MNDKFDSASYNQLARQLRLALDDAPSDEKAWVPLRRNLVLTVLEHLEDAEWVKARLAWAQAMMTNLLDPNFQPMVVKAEDVVDEIILLAVTPETLPNTHTDGGHIKIELCNLWPVMDRNQRIAAIRQALASGDVPDYLPSKRVWRRHYPEAFDSDVQLEEEAHAKA